MPALGRTIQAFGIAPPARDVILGCPEKNLLDTDNEREGSSSDDEEKNLRLRRWAKAVMILIVSFLLVVIVGATVLPWGALSHNDTFFKHLRHMREAGTVFSSACKFKMYNDFHGPSGMAGPWGKQVGGTKDRCGDLLGLYHHMGLLLQASPGPRYANNSQVATQRNHSESPQGNHSGRAPEYPHDHFGDPLAHVRLDFGFYGLHFHIIHKLLIDNLIPWDECTYWCGEISPEDGDPGRLLDLFESSLQRWRYNGIRFNCLQFTKYIFDFLNPTNTGCEKWDLS
eukprot:TRINITY_DN41198_c0_g1_i1.p1 TRINITY_DN41198_c0_g1~~TRINITY_DN41198_c0_g1_i1.p1  ORF type:complete len:298 (-),score=18.11 TRINITY_DN41198_c0_g1_i1:54-905(-)